MTVQTTGGSTITIGTGSTSGVLSGGDGISAGTTGTTPADGAGGTPRQGNEQAETIDSLPTWAQRVIKDLRQENENRRKAESENKRKAEEDRLAADAKWQQLAEERGKEADALRQTAERFDRLSKQLFAQAEREIAVWPEEVRSMRPETDDAETILAWADKARSLVTKLTATAPPGHGASPRPAGSAAGAANQAMRQEFERMVRKL